MSSHIRQLSDTAPRLVSKSCFKKRDAGAASENDFETSGPSDGIESMQIGVLRGLTPALARTASADSMYFLILAISSTFLSTIH